MCLDTINNKLIEKLPEEFTAYKIFDLFPNGLYAPVYPCKFKIGKNTCPRPKKDDYDEDYTPYFHVFKTLRGAKDFGHGWGRNRTILPVTIKKKDVKTAGYQEGHKSLVVKSLYIKKEDYLKACK